MAGATPDETHPIDLSYDEFEPLSPEEWRQTAVDSNGGKPFDKLTKPTNEGITLQPFYTAADTADLSFTHTMPGSAPYVRGTTAAGYLQTPWLVAQELAYPTPIAFNQALLDSLAAGQTAVNMVPDAPTRGGLDPDQAQQGEVGFAGLSLATVSDMTIALNGVDLAATPIMIRSGTASLPLLALLAAHVRRQGRPTTDLHGWLEDDPLGVIAQDGKLPVSLPRALDEMAKLTEWAARHAPQLGTIAIHTAPYHNAGANAVQELAIALATAVDYLRELEQRGVPFAAVAPRIRFDLAIGPQFFMEIAKFRTARMLWSQVAAAYGGDDEAQRMNLHARTGSYHKTLSDPTVNMLRVTTEALSAVIGGVDSLHVSPYDEPGDSNNTFSQHIARNVQIILQDEVHLTQLVDPAGGTWAVEALVSELAQKAWALFQIIEGSGGMWAALQAGLVQAEIVTVQSSRAVNLATRIDVLVGTNQFANTSEQPLSPDAADYNAIFVERAAQMAHHRSYDEPTSAHAAALDRLSETLVSAPEQTVESAIAAALAGATLNEITRRLRAADRDPQTIMPLPELRASEPFEVLRAGAAAYAAKTGRPPELFLANMGPPRQHKARADFAAGFFEVGGFHVINPRGFDGWEAAAEAALASSAKAIVICSTDETYPDLVPPLTRAIKDIEPDTAIILAGRPGDLEVTYRAAGVDRFIYLGADCLAANEWLLATMRAEGQTA